MGSGLLLISTQAAPSGLSTQLRNISNPVSNIFTILRHSI